MKNNLLLPGLKQLLTVMLLALVVFETPAFADEDYFPETIAGLTEHSFDQKEKVIDVLIQKTGQQKETDDRVLDLLQAFLNGKLYYIKSDRKIVYFHEVNGKNKIVSAADNQNLSGLEKHDLKKITVNNKLRRKLRSLIAELSLANKKSEVRLAAVKQMMDAVTAESVENIRRHLETEKNEKVVEAMKTLLAMVEVNSTDKTLRIAALENLGSSLEPKARNRVVSILEKDDKGDYIEADKDIVNAALKAKTKIDDRRKVYSFLEKIFFGLSLGSVLLLAAIGLAITFGVMGVINMAHGELIMIGAYTTYVVQLLMPDHIGLSLLVSVPAAFIVSGLFGIAIERSVIRFLYGRPLETLLATFGISLILQQLVRTIFSPLNRSVETPAWMSGALEINPVFFITYNRLTIVFFSLVVFALLMLILKRTSLGLKVRAVSQNRSMARAMGIRSEWVDAMTFGLGSGIAGIAGVALSQLTNVGPNLGQSYIIDSFLVVVFGGVGNLWGTLVGAMSLGVFNKFLEPETGAVLAKILILVFIILFIQKKPRGLFPQKGRAAEN